MVRTVQCFGVGGRWRSRWSAAARAACSTAASRGGCLDEGRVLQLALRACSARRMRGLAGVMHLPVLGSVLHWGAVVSVWHSVH